MIREGVMKKLLFSFFLICCAVPLTAEAADLFNTNGSFKVAKAVKLGRGSAYSVSASSNVNTGGKISSKKTCSAGCSDCDTTTGTCNACSGGYYNAGGTCIACSTIPVSNGTCTYCMGDEDYVSCEGAKCNTGYWDEYGTCKTCGYAIDNCAECNSTGSTCTKCNDGYTLANNECFASNTCNSIPDYNCYTINPDLYVGWLGEIGVELCANILSDYKTMQNFAMADPTGSVSENGNCTPSCSAGYYLKNGVCTACSSGTYSKGGTATSCSSCSTLYTSAGSNTCTSCTTTGTCTGSNGGSSSSSGSSSSCTPTIGYTCVNGVKTKCMYEGCASCATDTLKCVSCKPGYAYTAGSNCSS